eukprot:767837-Hanusia_phi.AAC.2
MEEGHAWWAMGKGWGVKVDASTTETKNITRENIRYYEGKPAGSDIVGRSKITDVLRSYMPSRNDFDVEWDNDAGGRSYFPDRSACMLL